MLLISKGLLIPSVIDYIHEKVEMKNFFILLIFHHLAMAQIGRHFTVGQSDFFHIWDEIRDYNWINNENYQIKHQILIEDGIDPNPYEMCFKHLLLLQETADSGALLLPNNNWALKMIDSTGKLPDGFLVGHSVPLGNLKECKDIEVSKPMWNGEQLDSFDGGWFYVFMGLTAADTNKNISERGIILDPILQPTMVPSAARAGLQGARIQYGVCAPSTCSRDFLTYLIEESVNEHNPYLEYGLKIGADALGPRLKNRIKPDFDGSDVAFLSFTSVLLTLILIGTLLEAWKIYAKRHDKWTDCSYSKFFINFSLYSNTKKLFDLNVPNTVDHIGCLDGIRFLSMTWVVMGHTFGNITGAFSLSSNGYAKLYESFWFQAVNNAFPSVDTFFLISGCLVSYLMLKELDKSKGRINFPMLYIHRYLRLTGTYAYLIFFMATVYRYMEYGPMHYQSFYHSPECRKSPWRQLLYINNFIADNSGDCIGQTWYLANDMQYFLFTPPLVYILWRWNIVGLIISGVLTLGSVIVPSVLHYHYAWPASPSITPPGHVCQPGTDFCCPGDTPQAEDADYMEWGYIKPWNRYSPYIVGVLLGYLLHITKSKQIKLSKLTNIWMWIVAFALGFTIVYGLDIPNHSGCEDRLPNLAQAIYGGFYAFVWGLSVAWVIFACSRGYGGWINELLSWKAFIPFSRISYIIYLVHQDLDRFMFGFYESTLPTNVTVIVLLYLAMLGYSCILSVILFIFVELPWLNTEKFIVGLLIKSKKPKEN